MADAVLATVMLDADCVERGASLFAAEFSAQNAGEGKADQRAFADDANMHDIFGVLLVHAPAASRKSGGAARQHAPNRWR